MILSFKHGFAFVAVPKTGTQSIRNRLRPHLAANDWEQAVFDEPRYFPVPALAALGHGHLSVQDILPHLVPGLWSQLYSFAFVRNPFDRFISFCTFFQTVDRPMLRDPAGTMKKMISDPKLRNHSLMLPQHLFLQEPNGNLALSFIGRYENLQKDFETVCAHLELACDPLPRINASDRRPVACDVDRELKEMITDYYRTDFDLFGYDAELPANL